MRELDLFETEIGDEGIVPLCRALRDNKTLERLNLLKTNMGHDGSTFQNFSFFY